VLAVGMGLLDVGHHCQWRANLPVVKGSDGIEIKYRAGPKSAPRRWTKHSDRSRQTDRGTASRGPISSICFGQHRRVILSVSSSRLFSRKR
jgi:hypothetical protein